MSYLGICGLELKKATVLWYFTSAPSKTKIKILKFGTKIVLIGYFGLEIQKSNFVFVISILEFDNMQSFIQKQETFKLGSKNTLFRYFWAIKTTTTFLIGSLEFVKT